MTTRILFLFCLLCLQVKSQVPGYYINRIGDTVRGMVNPKKKLMNETNWIKMQREIRFISKDGTKITLEPSSDIREIGFTEYYTNYRMVVFRGNEFCRGVKNFFDEDEFRFVKLIADGKIKTFSFYAKDPVDYNGIVEYYIYKRTQDNIWASLNVSKVAELGNRLFFDCEEAMRNFESNSERFLFHDCVLFYNNHCN